MYGLELQPTVEEVQPGGTLDVHGGSEHFLGKGLVDAEVGGRHGEVGESDLDVKGRGDHVGDEDERDAAGEGRDGAVEDAVAEPGPEEGLAGELEVAVPPCGALLGGLAEEEVFPGEAVEIEAAEGEEGVVEVFLPGDGEAGEGVVGHDAIVVGGAEGGEEAAGDGEEGHVFDVGVVFRGVGDDVVDVVVAFPPAEREATEEVGDEDADDSVGCEGVRDTHVAGVVGGEDELVPEHAEAEAGDRILPVVEEKEHGGEEEGVAAELEGVGAVVAVVEAFGVDAVVEGAVFLDDAGLGVKVERGVFIKV